MKMSFGPNFIQHQKIDYDRIEKLAYKKATGWIVCHQDITNCISGLSRFSQGYSEVVDEAINFYNQLLKIYEKENNIY